MTQMTATEALSILTSGQSLQDGDVITTPADWGPSEDVSSLPDNLTFWDWLDLSECPNMNALPSGLTVADGLDLSGNTQLTSIPAITVGGWLRVDGCPNLASVSESADVAGWVFRDGETMTWQEFRASFGE